MSKKLITLLTDFGLQDEYVGVMKGVILGTAPEVTIVDICHTIPPHDIRQAAYMLDAACKYFPDGSIHVAVVDPGVGSERRIICLERGRHTFIAPDNGILTPFLEYGTSFNTWQVENTSYFLEARSTTFHGRDIFAPVAAHLANGLHPHMLGPSLKMDELCLLHLPQPSCKGQTITGEIISIDHFGNCSTNLQKSFLDTYLTDVVSPTISVGNHSINGITATFGTTRPGIPLALINSRKMLEIAVNMGSAADQLHLAVGKPVIIHL